MNDTAKESARVEYAAAQEAYLHYDSFTWQVGAVLIAGVFVYWGFTVSTQSLLFQAAAGNLLVCLLMSCWYLYAAHNRQIYLLKLHRVRELEAVLGMSQHRRFTPFQGTPPTYETDGPAGHRINTAIYVISSFGGLLPSLLQMKADQSPYHIVSALALVIPFIVVLIVTKHARRIDSHTRAQIERLERAGASQASASERGS